MSGSTRPPGRTAPGDAPLPLGIPGLAGIGVAQFQLFNWGTFDGAVQRLTLDGDNGLLTGHVGSGKSTVVDGITTLFAAGRATRVERYAGCIPPGSAEPIAPLARLRDYENRIDSVAGSARWVRPVGR